MHPFYVFDEYGDFQFTTTHEDFASAWCDWWVEKYVKPENYTVKKVVVKL